MNEIEVSFEGVRSAVAPLTWPQRRTWRGSRFKYRLIYLQPVPPGRTIQDVCATLSWAYGEFEVLRTTYPVGADGEPYQNVPKAGTVKVRVLEPTSEVDIRSMDATFKQERHDVTTDIGVLFAIVVNGDVPTNLVCLTSHIALDAHGYLALREALAKHLAGEYLPASSPPLQPVDRARWEQSSPGRQKSARALRYWKSVLDRLSEDIGANRAGVMSSPALRAAAADISGKYEISTTAVCLAATAVVAGALMRRSACSLLMPASNRLTPKERSYVGELVQFAPGILDSLHEPFEVIARDAWRVILVGFRFGHYDEQALQQMTRDLNEAKDDERRFDLYFNDVRSGSARWEKEPAASGGLDELIHQTVVEPAADDHHRGPSRFLSVGLWDQEVGDISVNVHNSYFPDITVDRILLAIEALVVGVASDDVKRADSPMQFIEGYFGLGSARG